MQVPMSSHAHKKTRPDSYIRRERICEGEHRCRVTMTREYNGVWGNEKKPYKRMTNYSHFSGGLLSCSASLRLEDEILMYGVCFLMSVTVLRRGDRQTHCLAYKDFDSTIVVFRLAPTTEIIMKNKIT
jgi:hypothetical protein